MDYTPTNRKPQKVVCHTPIRGDVRRKKRDISETTHYFSPVLAKKNVRSEKMDEIEMEPL
jgi:hypothetical protein